MIHIYKCIKEVRILDGRERAKSSLVKLVKKTTTKNRIKEIIMIVIDCNSKRIVDSVTIFYTLGPLYFKKKKSNQILYN